MTCLLEAVGVRDTTTNKVQSCSSRSCLVGGKTHTRMCARAHTHVHLPCCDKQYNRNNQKVHLRGQDIWNTGRQEAVWIRKGKKKIQKGRTTSRWSNI